MVRSLTALLTWSHRRTVVTSRPEASGQSSTMQPPSLEQPVRTVNAEDARSQVSVILASDSFRRSERQSHFLRFICDLTLAGEAAKINEYLLAHAVFGRGPDYSPGEDSVVRRQA